MTTHFLVVSAITIRVSGSTDGLRRAREATTVAAVVCVADVMDAEFFPGADAVGLSAAGRLSA